MPHAPSHRNRLAFQGGLLDTSVVQLSVTQLTERLIESYASAGGINHLDGKSLPSHRTA